MSLLTARLDYLTNKEKESLFPKTEDVLTEEGMGCLVEGVDAFPGGIVIDDSSVCGDIHVGLLFGC